MTMKKAYSETFQPEVMLVTGGAGFIGCNFIRLLDQEYPGLRIINLDKLTYAGSLSNLDGLSSAQNGRYRFVQGDICDSVLLQRLFTEEAIDTVVHFAAESHVDRSISGPGEFIRTNIEGTCCLLQAVRTAWNGRKDVRFHHVSTDEVYGSLGNTGFFTEETSYDPSSPYSASKAASDHLVRAWNRTFGLPVTISNCSNNYGPYQFPEKLLPLMITKALNGEPLPVYGSGTNIRDWLYVGDHCRAIDLIVRRGMPGRTYNIGGCNEWTNIDVVHLLCDILMELRPKASGNYREQITFVQDRPGHDQRYAIDASRISKELGWEPAHTFQAGLRATIEWYLESSDWLQKIHAEKYNGARLGV